MITRIEYGEEFGKPAACFIDYYGVKSPLFHSREFGHLSLAHALSIHQVSEEDAKRLKQGLQVSELPEELTDLDTAMAILLKLVPKLEFGTPPELRN